MINDPRTTQTVLVVDDELDIRDMVADYLERQSYRCLKAANGEEALLVLRENEDCHIVLTDLSMPVMDGLEMIEKVRDEQARELQFIVMTGNGDKDKAVRALRLGVAEFLDKPVSWRSILEALKRAGANVDRSLSQSESLRQTSDLRDRLNAAEQQLFHSHRLAARQLANIARYKDAETLEHCERVGRYVRAMADLVGYSSRDAADIELAAILHDIGKVGIPDVLLMKLGPLSMDEFEVMTRHTLLGAEILKEQRDNPVFEIAYDIALYHHECWDGSGYPYGIAGEDIPVAARICAIADVYDALRSERRYKSAVDHDEALRIMTRGDGRTAPDHFDPNMLTIFLNNNERFARIFDALPDNSITATGVLESA
ncbi:MAG: response regulator [Rhodospirillales bacterium]|nr:response regulator [Rhodospirillales bacterium]MBO6786155.1 response regulator [Rhodospirillales bacterium]